MENPKPIYPLEGVVVLDLSQIYNGPYATYLMAVAGATVIKIEPPGGESLRRRGVVGGAGLPFAMLNGCKESIVLNLKTEEGKGALRELVKTADVLVENFSPGVMDRLGLGADELQKLNPNLIYASSSGYGRDGPYKEYPAMDLTVQAMGGIIDSTGFPDSPPVKSGPAIADFFAGTHFYGAILTALYDREHNGKARRVEVSMQDAVYASLSSNLGLHWSAAGKDIPPRTGNRHGGLAESPYNVYPSSDGYVAIICVTEGHWRALTTLMGQPELADDPRFSTLKERVSRMDLIDSTVAAWTSQHPKEWLVQQMLAVRVPSAPVRTLDEVVNDPNMHARGALEWQDHPDYGRIVVQQSPIRFDGLPPFPLEPSHRLGADTEKVLRERLGMNDEEIKKLL
ncbi:MAG: CoA transferase [Porticoccaceae bacterium]|nr:CoA transferase [Porticoccaceae bacterium]